MGEWNWRLIFWVAVGLFLLVYFGRNPQDEIRKRRAERASKRLVEKIEEANKKKGDFLNTKTPQDFGLGRKVDEYGVPIPGEEGLIKKPNPFFGGQPNPNAGNGVQPNPNTGGGNNGGGAIIGPDGIQGAPKDDYYPPAPRNPNAKIPFSSLPGGNLGNNPGMNNKEIDPQGFARSSMVATKALSSPNRMTDAGQELVFSGTKVYTYNQQGKLYPMPDGEYPMFNGRWTMVVRGGEQTIANGDTTGFTRAHRYGERNTLTFQ
jgi:hypothetical protein